MKSAQMSAIVLAVAAAGMASTSAGPAGIEPLQNARIGGYHDFAAAKLVVHSGNTGSAGANRSW
jgi:hypothetical protein